MCYNENKRLTSKCFGADMENASSVVEGHFQSSIEVSLEKKLEKLEKANWNVWQLTTNNQRKQMYIVENVRRKSTQRFLNSRKIDEMPAKSLIYGNSG